MIPLRSSECRYPFLAVGLAFVFAGATHSPHADEGDAKELTVRGVVVTAEQKPVAGAAVHVFFHGRDENYPQGKVLNTSKVDEKLFWSGLIPMLRQHLAGWKKFQWVRSSGWTS